ncbi:MAG: hypothetical protein Kapaf2KO_14060 [Candidatus Kapaibacteriales bacterium]
MLESELERNFSAIKKEDPRLYFVAYQVNDLDSYSISSSFGDLANTVHTQNRLLDIDLRIGDYGFDNTHIVRGLAVNFGSSANVSTLPLDNKPEPIKQTIWFSTDIAYKNATNAYEKAKANNLVKVEEEDQSGDLTRESKTITLQITDTQDPVISYLEIYAKTISSYLKGYDFLLSGTASINIDNVDKYLINTEGSNISWTEKGTRLMVTAHAKADDGMDLPLYRSYFYHSVEDLPKPESIKSDIEEMASTIKLLKDAPLMETYTGPAIFSGEAAAVFFHEIFGHRVEGHREKDPNSSQTFKDMHGELIFPSEIDVIFDPTIKNYRGNELSGYYPYDDQGIEGEKVISVKDGTFNSFLMSRIPIEGYEKSNGHGRRQPGYSPVARQSNLIVETDKSFQNDQLRSKLIKEVEDAGLEYGLLFETVQGGFTFTSRGIPNAFNVQPLVVYKVYPDGRDDELVRGVDVIGTPLTVFKKILASSEDVETFNGICGAESGGVPVSATSPALLIESIEIQKRMSSQSKPPLLSSPNRRER